MIDIEKEILKYDKFRKVISFKEVNFILNELSNPQKEIKTIHIGGTNGKGSTTCMLEAVLMENGLKVAKYTSPYLNQINEMFCIDNQPINDNDLRKIYIKVNNLEKKYNVKLTMFELTVIIGYIYFWENDVDILLLEVGIGGRYDSTNICKPFISIITNVEYDHVQILGNSLEEIAKEKAGIVRENVPLFTNVDDDKVLEIFKIETNNIFNVSKEEYDVTLDIKNLKTIVDVKSDKYEVGLFGKHQAKNFILVRKVLLNMGVENEVIKEGIKKVKFPGRMEVLNNEPLVLFDGAHNVDGVTTLVETMKFFKKPRRYIVSILSDKEVESMLIKLKDDSNEIIFIIDEKNTRSVNNKLLDKLKDVIGIEVKKELNEELLVKKLNYITVICGSFTMYSDVAKLLNKKN